jgi:hypothetical protein
MKRKVRNGKIIFLPLTRTKNNANVVLAMGRTVMYVKNVESDGEKESYSERYCRAL